MDQVPIIVYAMPIIALGLVFFMRMRMKSTLAKGEAENAASRAGEMAKRIGLSVVEGDPNLNLMYAHTQIIAGQLEEAKVRLAGNPSGRNGEVTYYERRETKTGMTSTTVTTYFDGRVAVEVRAPFPEFELVLRSPPSWVGTPKLKISASAHPFGDPALDQRYVLRTVDARIGPVIAPALANLASHQYVHIYGQGNQLVFAFSVETLTCMSLADQIYFTLDQMAIAIEQAAAQHGAA
jgi:hypothetical protein